MSSILGMATFLPLSCVPASRRRYGETESGGRILRQAQDDVSLPSRSHLVLSLSKDMAAYRADRPPRRRLNQSPISARNALTRTLNPETGTAADAAAGASTVDVAAGVSLAAMSRARLSANS